MGEIFRRSYHPKLGTRHFFVVVSSNSEVPGLISHPSEVSRVFFFPRSSGTLWFGKNSRWEWLKTCFVVEILVRILREGHFFSVDRRILYQMEFPAFRGISSQNLRPEFSGNHVCMMTPSVSSFAQANVHGRISLCCAVAKQKSYPSIWRNDDEASETFVPWCRENSMAIGDGWWFHYLN